MNETKKIHVVHVIPKLGYGGAERFVVDLTRFISSSEIHQSVVTLWDERPLEKELPPSVQCISAHFDSVSRTKRVSTLREILKQLKPDVIHTHLFGADLWGRLAAHSLGIPVVTTEHNINVDESKIRELVKRFMKKYSAEYTSPSLAVMDFMKKAYGIDRKKIRIIPHGVDLYKFKGTSSARFSQPFTLGIVGRLVEQKGHKIALEALPFLKDVALKLLIVGGGELEASLKQKAKELGVMEKIEWRAPTSHIASVYGECDMVLVPSVWEGFGLVALEAMASERLVIASSVGGLPEIIKHGKTGILVSPKNPKELAAAIRKQCADPAGSLSIARQAREWASEHADIHLMAERYEQIYAYLARQ